MYSILIVDDEILTLDLLKDYLPWEELTINRRYFAEDGKEALALVHEHHPDFIITDIKMPYLNGVDFIRQVTQDYPDTQFIFLSSYADKDHLLSAIKLHAVNFIEKPFTLEEVINSLKKAIELKSNAVLSKLSDSLTIRKAICQKMLNQHITEETLSHLVSGLNIHCDKLPYLCSFHLILDAPLETTDLESLPLIWLSSAENTYIFFYFNSWFSAHACRNYLVQNVFSQYDYLLSFGDNLPIADYQKSYTQSKKGLPLCFYAGRNNYVYQENQQILLQKKSAQYSCQPNNKGIPKFVFDPLKQLILKNKQKQLSIFWQQFYTDYGFNLNFPVHKLRYTFTEILIGFLKITTEYNYPTLQAKCNQHLNKIESCLTFEECFTLLKKLSYEISQEISHFKDTDYLATKIDAFLEENYNDQTFSINKLANRFNLTPSYVCHLYKSSTGNTIINRLTEIRMNHAKNLLSQTNQKIYILAHSVGYKDAKYFSRVFEKHYNISPLNYRKQVQAND